MLSKAQSLLLIAISLLAISCEKDSDIQMDVPSDSQALALGNVWVIGDSWSACHGDNTWRRTLYEKLTANQYSFDFIGTENDSGSACEAGQEFDRDHNAYGGIAAFELLERLPDWYEQLPTADNVLLMAGGNDLASVDITDVLQTLTEMITSLRSDNPNLIVYLAAYSYSQGAEVAFVDEVNELVANMASSVSTTQSPVYYTNLRPNFDPTIHELPDEHPNAAGMAVLADNWFAKINEVNGQ